MIKLASKRLYYLIPLLLLLLMAAGCGIFGTDDPQHTTVEASDSTSGTVSNTTKNTTTITSQSAETTGGIDKNLSIYIYIESAMMYAKENGQVLFASPVSIPDDLREGTYSIISADSWKSREDGTYSRSCLGTTGGFYLGSSVYFSKDKNTLMPESYYELGGVGSYSGLVTMHADAAARLYESHTVDTLITVSYKDDTGLEPIKPVPLDPEKMFSDPTLNIVDDSNDDHPYYIYVEKGSSTITIYSKDEDGQYTNIIRSYKTASGRTIGRTPAGVFNVGKKERWHEFAYPYDGGYAQYATYFYNNLMIHSPIYHDKNSESMTVEFYHDIGDMSTAGCLRTLSEAAYWIYTYCNEGTVVEIVNGSPKGTSSPDIPPIDPAYPNVDPTDPLRRRPVMRPVSAMADCMESDYVHIRTGPGITYPIIGRLIHGTRITATGEENGWYKVLLQGREAYVINNYLLIDHFEDLYSGIHAAYIPPAKGQEVLPNGSVVEVTDELVDLRALDQRFIVDLKFAKTDNFSGRVLYPNDICLLQKTTAQKLVYAQDIFEKDGYYIKIYDAYRPFFVQGILFDIVKDPNFVADPVRASHHNRGAAVDISLVHKDRGEAVFLTPMHTFSKDSSALAQRSDPETKELFSYFVSVMEQAGFYNYEAEWWHFSDTDWQNHMITDHDLSSVYIYDHIPTGE